MRITNTMMVSNLMRNLNSNFSRLDQLNNQLSTGRKFAHISDDPAALIFSQSARNKMARLSHYQGAVQTSQDWLRQSEAGVMELQKTLVSAYEEANRAANDYLTDSDKQNIAQVIGQLREHFVDTLNMTFGDKFVFGGYNTPGEPANTLTDKTTRAFTVEGDPPQLHYNGFNLSAFDGMSLADFRGMTDPNDPSYDPVFSQLSGDILTFDVGPGISMPATMNGIELVLFVTPDPNSGQPIIRNAFDVLQELFIAVNGDDTVIPPTPPLGGDEITKLIKPLQDAQNHLLTKTSEIGGRVNRLYLLEARYEQDEINYERMRSDAEDVDAAEVIMNLRMAEAIYQAALSAGARIIQPTLMDFLR